MNGTSTQEEALRNYKVMLRELVNRRPSGTRLRIAKSTGTHKSFISQILNPNYRVPLPVQHVPTLMRVCVFSLEEKKRFLNLYALAHPDQAGRLFGERHRTPDRVVIAVPEFADPEIRKQVEDTIEAAAENIIALAQALEGKRKETAS